MKAVERDEAVRLRSTLGMSLGEIANKLSVSKGSVSLWVRDIRLTSEQKTILLNKNPLYNGQCAGAKKREEDARELRLQYQQEGRNKAKEKEALHMAGCMLYWAEGSKKINTVIFTNSDINMMKFFLNFIRKYFNIDNGDIKIGINCYLNNNLTLEQIENYWIENLGITRCCLNKSIVNNYPSSSKKKTKKNKIIYGTCRICIHNFRIVQHIYGAIQEYAGFENSKWLK